MKGSEAAESGGAAADKVGAGVATRQPTASISNISPTQTEMVPVTARPSRKRLEDRDTVGDALRVERLDTVDARRSVEMLIVAPVATLRLALGRFLQVQFQPVQMTDGIETLPWFAERKAELSVIRDRTPKVVDEELGSE
jgi:hypothetical protein